MELPGGATVESGLRGSRIKLTKRCGEGGHLGKSVVEKNRELLRLDGKMLCAWMIRPPAKTPFGEAAGNEPVTKTIVT